MKFAAAFAMLLLVALLAFAASSMFRPCKPTTRPRVADQPSPDTPFVWPANTTLEATEEIIVVLPGSILADNEIFDSVIRTSSPDTRIAFNPPDGSAAFRSISLWLMPGVRLTLTKTAQVGFQTPDGLSGGGETFMKVVDDR